MTVKATLVTMIIWTALSTVFIVHTIQGEVLDKAFKFAIECVKSGGTYTKGECTR
jgi:hypothetical protein